MPSQFFDIILSTNVSCHHKNFKKFRLEIREKFHFEIRLRPSKITNNLVRACIAENAKNKQNVGLTKEFLGNRWG
jgi:hypothetical protein